MAAHLGGGDCILARANGGREVTGYGGKVKVPTNGDKTVGLMLHWENC